MADAPQQGGYGYISREDVAPFIPRGATSALDIGCSEGGFGESLRSALGPAARLSFHVTHRARLLWLSRPRAIGAAHTVKHPAVRAKSTAR